MTEHTPEEAARVFAFRFHIPPAVEETRWPANDDEATADQMILHALQRAFIEQHENERWMRYADLVDRGTEENSRRLGLWYTSTAAFLAQSTIALILHELQKRDPALADELAALAYDVTEDGGTFYEFNWEFLAARGVDAAQLSAWANDVATERFAYYVGVDEELSRQLGEPGAATTIREESGQ